MKKFDYVPIRVNAVWITKKLFAQNVQRLLRRRFPSEVNDPTYLPVAEIVLYSILSNGAIVDTLVNGNSTQ